MSGNGNCDQDFFFLQLLLSLKGKFGLPPLGETRRHQRSATHNYMHAYVRVSKPTGLAAYSLRRVDLGSLSCTLDGFGLCVYARAQQAPKASLHMNLTRFSKEKSPTKFLPKPNPAASVFPDGHPSKYSTGSTWLNFADLTRSGVSHVPTASSSFLPRFVSSKILF